VSLLASESTLIPSVSLILRLVVPQKKQQPTPEWSGIKTGSTSLAGKKKKGT
jgi:hypothetical protein